ncbi:MAG: Stk1 family PASTA domain-containing Ser/Thr kinase [Actinomycetaceae bacterium]|nr:Stk1 family PASTA domain-containing Ser/Thr kinase [Actinomycetaceae bacterium]MDY6082410.1 Stk1 family PASTA domain-containing Ser/Thr kinase [Actinomycetaceae bacterium]
MTDIPRVLAGRYEVGDLVGRGGMAEVHLGYDNRLSRTVAIKILRTDLAADATFLARFRREAQSAAALNHPAIVAVYDTGEEQVENPGRKPLTLPYIVMEYIKGRTVAALLSDGDPVPISEAIQITVGVLSALEYSHHEGIIHRDIKPGNIMLTPEGKVKVMDFGIARAIADSAATMTAANSVVGTAQYLSPEQARGEVVDARSDLYSAGCVLYELLTGRPPFVGDSAVAVAYQHVSEAPKPASQIAPDIPESIDRVVMKSLAKRREDRYQSAAEFRSDLLSASRGEGVDAPSITSWRLKPVPTAMPESPTEVASGATALLDSGSTYPTSTTSSDPFFGQTTTSHALNGSPASGDKEAAQRKAKKRRAIGIAAIITILAVLVALGAWLLFSHNGSKTPEPAQSSQAAAVQVPDMTGMDENAVRRTLEAAGLKYQRADDERSSTVEPGLFISSDPQSGTSVTVGSTVYVTFSAGPSDVTVPDLSGMTTSEAQAALDQAGLVLGNTTSVDDAAQPKDRIVSSNPGANKTVKAGTAVDVQISTGKVAVPEVTGLDRNAAVKSLQTSKLSVTVENLQTPDAEPGTVIDQNPGSNTIVSQGSNVTIVVAQKPQPTPTPSDTPEASPTDSDTASPTDSAKPSN